MESIVQLAAAISSQSGEIATKPAPLSAVFPSVIFFGVLIAGLLLYSALYDRLRRSRWLWAVSVLFALGASVFASYFVEEYDSSLGVVFASVVATGFPALYVYLRTKFEEMTLGPAAIRNDVRLSKEAREALASGLETAYDFSSDLNRLSRESRGPTGQSSRALLGALREKITAAIAQVKQAELFIREHNNDKRFFRVWQQFTNDSKKYLSVCDLSPFAGLTDPDFKVEKDAWTLRIEDEIAHLQSLNGKLEQFDKVIVYSPRMKLPNEGSSPCQAGPCVGAICQNSKCMVQFVTSAWSKARPSLQYKSHSDKAGIVWLVDRSQLDDLYENANLANPKETVASVDIGVFGDELFGEEFKLRGESFNLSKPSPLQGRPFGYLYQLRKSAALCEGIRRRIIIELNKGQLIQIA